MDFIHLYTSFDGRINRQPYWIAAVVLAVILVVVVYVLALLVGLSMGMGFGFLLLILLIQLAALYPSAALMVKRLHDRNKPGLYAALPLGLVILKSLTDLAGITGDPLDTGVLDYILGIAIFVVTIWFLIELGFLRGTQGPNQYGPDPLGNP